MQVTWFCTRLGPVIFQQLKCKYSFSKNMARVHCNILHCTSFLLNLQGVTDVFLILLCQTIYCLVFHLLDTGSMQDRKQSGWPLVICDDNMDNTYHTLIPSPESHYEAFHVRVDCPTNMLKTCQYCECIMYKLEVTVIFPHLRSLKENEKKHYEGNVILFYGQPDSKWRGKP